MTDASAKDAFVNLKLIPDWITLDQYKKLLVTTTKFLQMFWNSTGLVVPIVTGEGAVAALAAYAFARLRFRGRDTFFMIYLMTKQELVPLLILLGTFDVKLAVLYRRLRISVEQSARGENKANGSKVKGFDAYATSKQCNLATVLYFASQYKDFKINVLEPGFNPGTALGKTYRDL